MGGVYNACVTHASADEGEQRADACSCNVPFSQLDFLRRSVPLTAPRNGLSVTGATIVAPNREDDMSKIIGSGTVGLLCVFAMGCGEAPAPTSTETSAPLLFEDPSTEGPRLDVIGLGGEGVGVSVSGPIGTDPPAMFDGSLIDLYRQIHPDVTEVPAELVELNADVEAAWAALPTDADVRSEAPVTVDKDQNAFLATTCKTFSSGSVRYVPWECNWVENDFIVWAGHPQGTLTIAAGDRTYGWNEVSVGADLNWCSNTQCIAGQIHLPAYWWNWMSLVSGGPYYAYLIGDYDPQTHTFPPGRRGLTHHYREDIVR